LKQNEIEIKLPPKFKGLFKPARYKIYYGGRGGAKSWTIATALISRAYTEPLRILCTREFQSSIADSVHRLISDQIQALGLSQWFDITRTSITSTAGAQFFFKGLRHSIQEIKSTEGIDIVWVEEAQVISQNSWRILIPTIRKEASEIWISFNPEMDTDPTYQRFVINTPPNSVIEKVGWQDNPYFPDVLDAERRYMLSIDPEAYQHVWEGFCRQISDAQIFRGRFSVETFDEPPPNTRLYYGLDFGFSQSPTALIRCWINNKTLYIDYEAYGIGVELDDMPEFIGVVPGADKWPIMADNARPETISHLRRRGYNVEAAPKWGGSVEDGIAIIKGFQRIVIHERCEHTATDFRLYSYKVDQQTEDVLPLIEKKWDDCCLIAGTMVATINGDIPIENIKTGDLVLTRDGYKKVLFSGATGHNRPIVKVKIGKKTIVCTPDHKIFLEKKGFTFADALRYGDLSLTLTEDRSWSKQLNTTGTRIEGIRPVVIEHLSYIFTEWKTKLIKSLSHYIDKYGKIIMEIFLKDIISTIKTAIHQTIMFQTFPVFLQSNITANTSEPKNKKSRIKSILIKLDTLLKNGMQALKVLKNIEKSGLSHIKTLFQSRKNVSNAAVCFYQNKLATETNSVQTNVNLHGGDYLALMMSKENACCVGSSLPPTNIKKPNIVQSRVHSVLPVGTADHVYDLTVEDSHEFFAEPNFFDNCVYQDFPGG